MPIRARSVRCDGSLSRQCFVRASSALRERERERERESEKRGSRGVRSVKMRYDVSPPVHPQAVMLSCIDISTAIAC